MDEMELTLRNRITDLEAENDALKKGAYGVRGSDAKLSVGRAPCPLCTSYHDAGHVAQGSTPPAPESEHPRSKR